MSLNWNQKPFLCIFTTLLTCHSTKTFEHKTLLSGTIARAAAVFCVDEIIVFDDDPSTIPPYLLKHQPKNTKKTKVELQALVPPQDEGYQNPDQFLFHLLSYMECPPFLRVPLIPRHENLNKAGMLPSLDMPHHLRAHDWCQYREGMVEDTEEVEAYYNNNGQSSQSKKKKRPKQDAAKESIAYVACGLQYPVKARTPITVPTKARVTIRFSDPNPPPSWPHLSREEVEALEVDIVVPEMPREEGGFYWGYTVRKAASLSAIFTESPFEGGYDCNIGTSERGVALSSLLPIASHPPSSDPSKTTTLPTEFSHMLLVFGGREGLEPAVVSDPTLVAAGLTKETTSQVFDFWVNLVPGQGSRTIRTEEAVWVGLMGLRGFLEGLGHRSRERDDLDSVLG